MKKIWLGILTAALLVAMTAIGAFAAETVIYENDFSNPATLADFKQYRTEWEIKDGGLFLTDKGTVADFKPETSFSHIIYQGANLTDYIVEVDYKNIQTAGGIIFNADKDAAGNSNNGFYGYIAFISNDATKGALGCADEKGGWKGNIFVGNGGNCNMGDDVHIKVVVKGGYIHETITNIANGKTVFDYTYKIGTNANDVKWVEGTVGLRMRSENGPTFAVSAGNAYFDNFKVTTANEATISESSAGTGTAPATTPTVTAKAIDTSKLTPVYTQDFESADALKDFTSYLGNWGIRDGKLYMTGLSGKDAFSFLLFNGDEKLTKMTDYVLDCDMYNTQTSAGPIVHAELDKVVETSPNGFAGYLGFVASDGKKFAVGTSKNDGDWDGNLNVGTAGTLTPGSNVHVQFAVKGDLIQLVVTDLASGKEVYSWSGKSTKTVHNAGSFGFRFAGESKANALNNVNVTGVDNLVISTYGAPATQKTEVKLTIGQTTAYVNGKAELLDAAPIIEGGRTLMPLRFIAEAMGAKVDWSAATSTATLDDGTNKVVVTLNSNTAYVNGKPELLDAAPTVIGGRTLLPVRFIAESFGAEVAWDGATSTATLTK
ncbi:MAG: copper amine oxidase N-terminal domain-containing protein [Clostridia bacterium]|nr:copper amine oxidase N-terminal domain-containing protein [Clostridia bacterium]